MSTGKEFLIPFAYDLLGNVVSRSTAIRGESYLCCDLNCKDRRLRFRSGTKTRSHFAHLVDTNCNGETLTHILAKMILRRRINDGHPVPVKHIPCSECGFRCVTEDLTSITPKQTAIEEYTQPNGSRPDIMVMTEDGIPAFAIEIFVTHKSSTDRAELLGVSFIEFSGIDVVEWADGEYKEPLESINSSMKSYRKCHYCSENAEQIEKNKKQRAAVQARIESWEKILPELFSKAGSVSMAISGQIEFKKIYMAFYIIIEGPHGTKLLGLFSDDHVKDLGTIRCEKLTRAITIDSNGRVSGTRRNEIESILKEDLWSVYRDLLSDPNSGSLKDNILAKLQGVISLFSQI